MTTDEIPHGKTTYGAAEQTDRQRRLDPVDDKGGVVSDPINRLVENHEDGCDDDPAHEPHDAVEDDMMNPEGLGDPEDEGVHWQDQNEAHRPIIDAENAPSHDKAQETVGLDRGESCPVDHGNK